MMEMMGQGLPVLYWHWLTLGVILITLEALLPGTLLLWFGLAALVVGVTQLLLPGLGLPALALTLQVALFLILAFLGIAIGRSLLRRSGQDDPDADVSRRSRHLIGQRARVIEPLRGGLGRVQIADSPWRALGPDADVGDWVLVEAIDGASLRVRPVSD